MAQSTFAYRVKTRDGRTMTGSLVADGAGAVASTLQKQGLIPLDIKKESKVSMKMEFNIKPKKVKLKDLAIFSRQFATMISGGLTLLRALTILSEQTENPLLAQTIKHVSDDVEGGASLSEAMTKYPKAFNQLYVSLVRAGETGGQLETVLTRVADTYEAEYKLRQKVKSAMTYPVVVAFIAISLLIVMLIFIVPTFAAMFEDLGGKLPLPTQILVTMSENSRVLVPLFIIGIVAARIIYKKLRKSNEKAALFFDKVKLKIPVFGELFRKIAMSRFTRTLSLLLRAGVPVLQSLEITGKATGNEVLNAASLDIREAVRQGESMASPLENHPIFPPMVIQMISVGEDTGALDSMLDKISDFYDQEVESMTESLTSLIEPIMIAVLGGIVGGMVIALYMPMFKIFELIK
jgi:type IV pilus assembly protein PilC